MTDNILGIDPGGTTGTTYWVPSEQKYYYQQWETPQEDETGTKLRQFYNWLERLYGRLPLYEPIPDMTIVLERFDFRHEETARDKIDYSAREVIGCVKLFCANYAVHLVMQNANLGKEFWVDDKLRRIGMYRGTGKEVKHSTDGLRHLLYYRTFTLNDKSLLMRLK